MNASDAIKPLQKARAEVDPSMRPRHERLGCSGPLNLNNIKAGELEIRAIAQSWQVECLHDRLSSIHTVKEHRSFNTLVKFERSRESTRRYTARSCPATRLPNVPEARSRFVPPLFYMTTD